MTIRHAGASRPRIPSHRVEVGGHSLVLLRRDEDIVIQDQDVHSIRVQTFCQRPTKTELLLNAPRFGYRVTTLVHGPDRIKTRIRLEWKEGEPDRLEEYRLRVADVIAGRIRKQVGVHRSVEQNDWKADGDCLQWNDGRTIQLSQVNDIRYFGDDAAVWLAGADSPMMLESDSFDQLILTELVQHHAREHSEGAPTTHPLGKKLFELKHDRRTAIRHAYHRLLNSEAMPLVVATGVAALFFMATTLVGAIIAVGGIPNRDDWTRVPPLALPFVAMFLIGAVPLVAHFAFVVSAELLRRQKLDVYERGLVLRGWRRQAIRFDEIEDYAVLSQLVYHGFKFAHSSHQIGLAIANGEKEPKWYRFHWREPLAGHGRLTFLSDLLKIAVGGKHTELADKVAGPDAAEHLESVVV